MSTNAQTDENDGQKSEKQFLTLADKKPSVIRASGGTQSVSARTISTRELSDNLQRTRDGMINLMRKKRIVDGLERIDGSDGEDETDNIYGMPRRHKPKRGGNSTRAGSIDGSLDDITNGRRNRGQRRQQEFGSGEFSDGDPNDKGFKSGCGMNNGMFKTKNSQGEKTHLGSDLSSNGYLKRSGRGQFFKNENDKRFKSQNPKKDGPLSTRIFIDAFLPSLEGNRIFPLFNYRCSEKIERTSKNFKERNSKRLNNQLAAVSSTDAKEDDTVQSSTELQIQKDGESSYNEKILKVKEYRNEEGIKIVDQAQNIDELRVLDKVEECEQQRKLDKSQELRNKIESQEVVQVHGLQQIEELHKAKEIQEVLVLENVDAVDRKLQEGLQQTITNTGRTDAGDNNAELIEGKNEDAEYLKLKRGLSTEEESLLQKLLRILKENEELVDFFCEKVISKIAARNDFCGPNCKGTCGGLNTPSKVE